MTVHCQLWCERNIKNSGDKALTTMYLNVLEQELKRANHRFKRLSSLIFPLLPGSWCHILHELLIIGLKILGNSQQACKTLVLPPTRLVGQVGGRVWGAYVHTDMQMSYLLLLSTLIIVTVTMNSSFGQIAYFGFFWPDCLLLGFSQTAD